MTRRNEKRETCARCTRPDQKVARRAPDGALCAACAAKAFRTTGTCASCGAERLTPGVDPQGRATCCPCAGIDLDYHCTRCGREWLLRNRLCEWCHLSDVLDGLLAGPVDLGALKARLLDAPRPDSIIIWLYDERVRQNLQDLAAGRADLTHDALDAMTPLISVSHLRELLVAVGLLEARDERLARFDRRTRERIAAQPGHHRDVLTRFTRWGLRPALAAAAQRAPLRDGQVSNATQMLRVAGSFLDWLDKRGRDLTGLEQFSIDTWFATPPVTHRTVRTFLRWAVENGQCPRRLKVPKAVPGAGHTLSGDERLTLLSRLLDPATGPLAHRAAGVLLVLLGQPYTRISTMAVDDIIRAPRKSRSGCPAASCPCPTPSTPCSASSSTHGRT